MEVITPDTAARMIRDSKGKLFGVTFVKRGDRKKMPNTPDHKLPRRRMMARVDWRRLGGKQPYDPASHDLITVYEFVTKGRDEKGRFATGGSQFRNVPIEGIEEIRLGGKVFKVQNYLDWCQANKLPNVFPDQYVI